MTMAGPPRDTPAESRADLQQAWVRMRAWFHKQWGKSFPYVATMEVGGKNGLIHLHVVAKFPKNISYSLVGDQWERAYSGAGNQGVDFAKRRDQNGKVSSVLSPEHGAKYVAKYATKGSELLELPPELAAQTLNALTGFRLVRASQGFWTEPEKTCKDCGCYWGLATRERLAEIASENRAKEKLDGTRPCHSAGIRAGP